MHDAQNTNTYAHTTSLETLKKILNDDGHIKSLRHIAKKNPNLELSVEPLPVPIRFTMPAEKAYNFMEGIKEPSKIFLTRNGYLPNYGNVVITKNLGDSVRQHTALNSIPEEYTTRRELSLRNNANIYVPDENLDELAKKFSVYNFKPLSKLELKPFGLRDRASALWNKIKKRLGFNTEEGNSLNIKPLSDSQYRKKFGINAQLVGSEALGINVPGSSDIDVFVPYKRKAYFDKALERMKERYPSLKLNAVSKKREDKKTFTGSVDKVPMDVVIAYGPRAEKFREAFNRAKDKLTEKQKADIVKRKAELKNSWFFPETRYKMYKKQIAADLGLKEAYF